MYSYTLYIDICLTYVPNPTQVSAADEQGAIDTANVLPYKRSRKPMDYVALSLQVILWCCYCYSLYACMHACRSLVLIRYAGL